MPPHRLRANGHALCSGIVLVQNNHLRAASADGLQIAAVEFLSDSCRVIHGIDNPLLLVGDQCSGKTKQQNIANGVGSDWPHRKTASGWLLALLCGGFQVCWLVSVAEQRV